MLAVVVIIVKCFQKHILSLDSTRERVEIYSIERPTFIVDVLMNHSKVCCILHLSCMLSDPEADLTVQAPHDCLNYTSKSKQWLINLTKHLPVSVFKKKES